jgi:Ser/Thr protein kinase RdoA (MazF antagonist)
VLSDNHGRTAFAEGGWTWEVHAEGTGDDVYREVRSWEPFFRADHAFAAGAMLAEIACAAADFTAPRRQHTLLVTSWDAVASADLLTSLARYVEARPLLAEALAGRPWRSDVERDLIPLHAKLVPYVAELPPQWTHGDGHASNFLWRGNDVTAVLDLGLADRTTPILDLATAIERNCISWLDPDPAVRYDLVDPLLSGWSSVRPFTALDRAALIAMLPLAHVEFALSELAYFAGVTRSRPNADLAYEGYLLGHARWFTADAGTELLSRLA